MRLRVYDLQTVFERLNRHKIPTMIPADHFEKETSAYTYGWDQVEDICRNFPDIPVILLQPKYAAQNSLISMMRRHPNLHFTIPLAARFRQLETMVRIFGAQRAIFGTNLPFVDPALPIGMIQYGALSEDEKCLIAGDNLKRLLANAG
jgi:predicted TIM-barrel fold metal-dependent hydrolase